MLNIYIQVIYVILSRNIFWGFVHFYWQFLIFTFFKVLNSKDDTTTGFIDASAKNWCPCTCWELETGGQLHNKWNNLDVFSMSVRWQPPIGGCWMQLQVHMTNALQNGTNRWHICTFGWSDQRLIQWICNVYFRSMNPIRYIKINPINMQCPSTADLFSMDPIRIVPILSEGAQKGSNTDW